MIRMSRKGEQHPSVAGLRVSQIKPFLFMPDLVRFQLLKAYFQGDIRRTAALLSLSSSDYHFFLCNKMGFDTKRVVNKLKTPFYILFLMLAVDLVSTGIATLIGAASVTSTTPVTTIVEKVFVNVQQPIWTASTTTLLHLAPTNWQDYEQCGLQERIVATGGTDKVCLLRLLLLDFDLMVSILH